MRPRPMLLACLVLFLAAALITPFIGSQPIAVEQLLAFESIAASTDATIFFKIRLPRVLLALMAGGTLALAGVVFQALLRNSLATPYTLGIASGSAFGALLMIKTGVYLSFFGYTGIQVGAFIGSLVAVAIVYSMARRLRRLSVHTLILGGVTVNFIFSAAILILHYIADFTETHQMIRWTIGGLDSVDYWTLLRTLPVLFGGLATFIWISQSLNILSTSEEIALSKGVNVGRVQTVSFIVASIMTGNVVALSGPIGFLGLIVPHLLRIVAGPDHRYLVPASFLFGGAFLAVADSIARTVLAPIDLPVGIFTTLIGGPCFLWLLMRNHRTSA